MKQLSTQDLLITAQHRTGLTNFGPDDFREGFEILVEGINSEVQIREECWEQMRERFLRLLMNRLWFANDLDKHPEILDEDLGSPIVISSLPRTASTKLHRMLGASGDFQVARLWQIHMFAGIPGLEDNGRERRIQETREYEKWVYQASPKMLTGHAIFTDEPEEDMLLGEFTFRHSILLGIFDSPSYMEWLMQADMAPMYAYLEAQLKYLQWQNKADAHKPWLLKTPIHFGSEQRLIDQLGESRFVVTHRSPAKCIPSISSTTLGWREMYSENCSVESSGAAMSAMFSHGAAEHIKWRDAHPNIPVLDLAFNEVTNDGISAIRKVYERFNMPLSVTSENAMLAWEKSNSQHKHGKHQYSAAGVGVSESVIEKDFSDYNKRFLTYL